MGVYNLQQIGDIIRQNPNKDLIKKGREINRHLLLHLHGTGIKSCEALAQDEYFENQEAFNSRIKRPISNKDMMSRLLQEEDQVFSSRGGSAAYGMNQTRTKQMDKYLADVRYGYSLRRWVKNFALSAYRADPMGIIFMEREKKGAKKSDLEAAYPTYKSIQDIFDYQTNGRQLEYVCFNIKRKDLKAFGINDPAFRPGNDVNPAEKQAANPTNKTQTPYFRFVDDSQDIIVKREQNTIAQAKTEGIANPVDNPWMRTPAIIVSDLIQFDDPSMFGSPLQYVVELADDFLFDRSIRGLQKKFHGFAKAIEPLLKCGTCGGDGVLNGGPCPDCSVPGATKGTGWKLRTKISDVAKFPIDILSKESGAVGFDFNKIFGYVTPPIDALEYMDLSLAQTEQIIYFTYWGVPQVMQAPQGPATQANGEQKTATEVVANLKPKYTRLNTTADWAEKTENLIADFLGEYYFGDLFKGSQIAYGRSYILETPSDLLDQFYKMRAGGVPKFILIDQLERYLRALYQNNPVVLAKMLKLLAVEPMLFTVAGSPATGPTQDYTNAWELFPEWLSDQDTAIIASTKPADLRANLMEYIQAKKIPPPVDPNAPVPGKSGK